jgi:hypothetical protein
MPQVTSSGKVVVVIVVALGVGLISRAWLTRQSSGDARQAYFERGRAHAPRVLEEIAPLPDVLRESSGLAFSKTQPGVIWSHNDSGDRPTLFAIDLKARVLATVLVDHAVAQDWEDIAAGPCPLGEGGSCLYIADTGNNGLERNVLAIYVVAEPPIAGANPAQPLVARARSFQFRYPGQPEDTEALAVLPNRDVTLVSKGRTPAISFFSIPAAEVARGLTSGDVLTASNQGDTGIAPDQNLGRWVTSAAVSPDGKTLAVRTYSEIFFYAAENGPQGVRWRDLKRPCFLGDTEPQGEAIDYLDDRTLVIGSETTPGHPGVLHRVQC